MNYLAHFQLATLVSHEEHLPIGSQLTGAFLADHLTGEIETLRQSPPHTNRQDAFWESVQIHRRVDTLTDTHPAAIQLKDFFPEPYRRYAPVLIDVLFDAVLAEQFADYHVAGSTADLGEFATHSYQAIHHDYEQFPDNWTQDAIQAFSHMRSHNWLLRYATLRGIEKTLAGISQRLRRPLDLTGALVFFEQHKTDFSASFAQLWPDIQQATLTYYKAQYSKS